MLLYVDLDLGRFVGAPGFGSPARATEHKRGDGGEISIQFCQGTTLVSLPDSSDIIYQGKAAGKYDAAPLIECSTFANAATSGGVHTGALTYDVTALNTALLVDNDDSNDLAFLNAMFEVTWRPPGKGWASTDTLSGKINNDVVRSSQGLLPAISSELPGVLATARATFGGTATINITVGALTVGTWSVNLWDGSTGSAPAVPYLSYGGSGNWSEWVAAFVQLINTGGVTASGFTLVGTRAASNQVTAATSYSGSDLYFDLTATETGAQGNSISYLLAAVTSTDAVGTLAGGVDSREFVQDDFVSTLADTLTGAQKAQAILNLLESSALTVPGDLESTGSANGLILESPNGTRHRVTVSNAGALSIASI
tara:strand:+ start:1034 stop:2140 length:1107 start_codon:yes stop_codon:yes gene_type:complete